MKEIPNEEFYSLYFKWQESGKNKAAFANSESVPKATFYYWCRKFDTDTAPIASNSSFSIIPMRPVTAVTIARINYPSGDCVELFGTVDVSTVRELLG
jgi:hypothetical protein